jgi:hypothetical protein
VANYGPLVVVFDELFGADERLRGEARSIGDAAADLAVDVSGLPPEAKPIVAAVRGLRGRLDRAERKLTSAASMLGQLGTAAKGVDLGWFWNAVKGNVVPPGNPGPLGVWPWILGRFAFGAGAGLTGLQARYGTPFWVKDGPEWRVFGSGPRLNPQLQRLASRLNGPLLWGGAALTAAGSFSRRMGEGASAPEAVGGAAGETGTVVGCATAGARAGAAAPVPHPLAKAALVLGGGLVGGAACSAPGRWVGDRFSDGVGWLGDRAGEGADWVGDRVDDGADWVEDNVDITPWDGAAPW